MGNAIGRRVGGTAVTAVGDPEYPLRSGLEQSYRALATLAPGRARRIELVDRANEVRPRTWL